MINVCMLAGNIRRHPPCHLSGAPSNSKLTAGPARHRLGARTAAYFLVCCGRRSIDLQQKGQGSYRPPILLYGPESVVVPALEPACLLPDVPWLQVAPPPPLLQSSFRTDTVVHLRNFPCHRAVFPPSMCLRTCLAPPFPAGLCVSSFGPMHVQIVYSVSWMLSEHIVVGSFLFRLKCQTVSL